MSGRADIPPRRFAATLSEQQANAEITWAVALAGDTGAPPVLRWLDAPDSATVDSLPSRDEILIWMAAIADNAGAEASARADPPAGAKTLGLLDLERGVALLAADEKARMLRLRHERDRALHAAAHAGVRLLLGRVLGAPSETLRFETNTHGKPRLAPQRTRESGPPALHFNISHAGVVVAVAIARRPVGIDVEPFREVDDLPALSRTVLTSDEQAALGAGPAATRSRRFLRFWTLKEAVLKAAGTGFSVPPHELSIDAGTPPRVVQAPARLAPATQWVIAAAPEFSGAADMVSRRPVDRGLFPV